MDGLLLPAKAAHMEAQSCHGWVTAIKAAWCAAMRGLLKSGEPVLDSGPVLGCASRAAPSAAAEAPAAWILSCIAGHWNSTWVTDLYSPTHKDTHASRPEWQSDHSRGLGKSWDVCPTLPCTERLAEAKRSGVFIVHTRWFKFFTFPALPATSRTNKALNSSTPCLLSL